MARKSPMTSASSDPRDTGRGSFAPPNSCSRPDSRDNCLLDAFGH